MNIRKAFLWTLGVPFLLMQAYWTFNPSNGIVETYGFWNAFPQYFALHWGNGLLMAGLTDFMLVIIVSFVWMWAETPKEERHSWKFPVWLVSYVVFPGLGFLVYFLLLNPKHRFVAD
ncbi:hypothetical protein HCU74_01355 [Spongiibacter sp. KMU-166]|uniref:Cardiolipin synthase N-terminal domain-containing protein n=1 Tax=Spongiibacter thalassae TaxID=2721624 RepID=A0ABX1GA64_9GAMM|nr:hypothetical protein [Spongiibacter thalassae]NKI16055.1 hypothetical protein [Spongiibacter thalassae]